MASPTRICHAAPVHVVVTCSNRKRYPIPARLRLGDLHERRPSQRFSAWTRRLSARIAAEQPAVDLYAGEHWQVARTLPSLISHRPAMLWVCSAGYGLIPASMAIQPYAATFALGEVDSVGGNRVASRDWWTRLIEWADPAPDQPRSFVDLAHRTPNATIVAVLSDAYQRACGADIAAATHFLHDSRQLSVVGRANAELSELVVPVTARLQAMVGGSRLALNVRVAAYLLRTANEDRVDPHRNWLLKQIKGATRTAPTNTESPARRRLTDHEVCSFIRTHLANSPDSATTLLRRLRQSGQSCEQARFAKLYAKVSASMGVSRS